MSEPQLQLIRIYESTDRYIIQNIQTSTTTSVFRYKKLITFESPQILNNLNIYKVHKSFGILGIINLNLYNYIISITESKKIGKIGNTDINQILDIEFIQIDQKFEGKQNYNFDYINFEINQLIAGMRKIISEGCFYSHDFDLTNSLQNQKNLKISNNNTYDILQDSNWDYLFNKSLLIPFFENEIFSPDILVNSIYGYINILKENINNIDITYILLSRRNIKNLDLQTFSLGFDNDGNSPNFIETEQIFFYGINVFSYVQIKTPPPLYNNIIKEIYNSENFSNTKLDINMNSGLLSNHFLDLNKNYRFIYLINLLNKNNKEESFVTNVLESNIKIINNQSFKYNYFNFDKMCLNPYKIHSDLININENFNNENLNEKLERDNIEKFLYSIESVLNIFKFFGVSFDGNNKILTEQAGIIRVFCKDGLERSNIIQMRIGWFVLEMQMISLGINAGEFFGADIISVKNYEKIFINNNDADFKDRKGIEFIIKVKKVWKENSQRLALYYTGENRGGSEDSGKNQEIKFNIDVDEYLRQNCLDILLNRTQLKFNSVQDTDISKCLEDNIHDYCKIKNMLVFIGTYNLGGRDFRDCIDLLDWLLPIELKALHNLPELYVIGLQEIVELNASNILITSNSPKVEYWKNTIQTNLDAIGKYHLIKCLDLVGVVMLIYAHPNIIDKIKNFDFLIQKTGMMGTMGNKGSCLMRFEIEDTSLAFSSGHYAAGQNANSSRITELNDVLCKNFQVQRSKKLSEHDIFIVFGDLNFRVDLDNNSVRSLIAGKNLETLNAYDQFLKSRNVNLNLFILDEGKLSFNPTYKYNFGSDEYDSKAKRIPSWCDRIFYKKTKLIKQICYNRTEYVYSDHKPVYSVFDFCVIEEVKEEKKKLYVYFKRNLTFGIPIKSKMIVRKDEMHKNQNVYNQKIMNERTQSQIYGNEINNKINNSNFYQENVVNSPNSVNNNQEVNSNINKNSNFNLIDLNQGKNVTNNPNNTATNRNLNNNLYNDELKLNSAEINSNSLDSLNDIYNISKIQIGEPKNISKNLQNNNDFSHNISTNKSENIKKEQEDILSFFN